MIYWFRPNPLPAPGLAGQERHFGLPRGFGDGPARLDLGHLPAEFRSELGACVVAEGEEDPGAEGLQERPPRLGGAQDGSERGYGLGGDDGDDAALPGEGKRLLVSARGRPRQRMRTTDIRRK